MSYNEKKRTISLIAAADLSTSQFLFGTIDSNGQLAVSGAGAVADGVIDGSGTAGQAVPMAVEGVVEIRLGATLAAGATVASAADGRAVTAAAGSQLGKLIAGGIADDVVPMLWEKVA
ncbi:capsid cement protein [Chelativorans sp. AA-79]|uniref:capsid cement protein n=1 Tax=Chelativorans sp. AA-79 TaxID=3028735 RepID=UPI0023F6ACED|nr:capsid cement protein [Chelativorans sp. AA-79]WEX10286.1 DUF2190 family protein [Chelativorans sp. AA-79]